MKSSLLAILLLIGMISCSIASSGAETIHPLSELSASSPAPVSEPIPSAELHLIRPGAADLIPYTERGFDEGSTAAISWWMAPDFMNNTSEYRGYLRQSEENRLKYPEEKQIFFNFITNSLDQAESSSTAKEDLILYRGISPGLAASVLNNSVYREPAYASTSYDITVCLDIFGPRSADGYQNVLVLQRKAGDHLLYINEDEREFLIPRNTDWHLIKSVDIDNLTISGDFPLHLGEDTHSLQKVRLIYIREEKGGI